MDPGRETNPIAQRALNRGIGNVVLEVSKLQGPAKYKGLRGQEAGGSCISAVTNTPMYELLPTVLVNPQDMMGPYRGLFKT